jgi:hypothetical protein
MYSGRDVFITHIRRRDILLPAYPQYPDEVSLDEIEQAFLSDRKMYLSGMLSDIFCLQIYHSEGEDAENDECVLILMVGDENELEEGEDFIGLNSMVVPKVKTVFGQK